MGLDLTGELEGLARRIRSLREAAGLTQEDLAARCDISVSFASLLERGERSPSFETLLQIASALGRPLAALFESEGNAGEGRLAELARERGLTRYQVDQLLGVAELMFPEGALAEPAGSTCGEAGCGKAVLARGLCMTHYHRARRARIPSAG